MDPRHMKQDEMNLKQACTAKCEHIRIGLEPENASKLNVAKKKPL